MIGNALDVVRKTGQFVLFTYSLRMVAILIAMFNGV